MASPIEKRLLAAICDAAERHELLIGFSEDGELYAGDVENYQRYARAHLDHAIGSYRVDILLAGFVQLAIECDGHDFHDRTKQQAAYDRARDRELLLGGVITIRFTGSEIVHSAERCADEAIRVFMVWDEREEGRMAPAPAPATDARAGAI